jgi:hypothetical protein
MARSYSLILAAAILCIGCKNPYTDFYHPYQTVIGNNRFAQPQGDPSIYSYSANVDQDNRAMRENGFVMVGYSSFNGNGNAGSQENVITQARTVGASVVMLKNAHAGTRTGVMPYTTYNPGQVITTNSSGTANAYGTGGSAYGSYQGTSTTYVPGTSNTQMVPYTVQRYDFLATYWAKSSKIRLGVVYLNLPTEMRQRLQRNTGVVADLIIKGSPAFISNILVGDVILKINDEDVIDGTGFSGMLDRFAGKQVVLTIIRGSEQKLISLHLNE